MLTIQASALSHARLVGAQGRNVKPRAARAQRLAVRPAAAAADTEASAPEPAPQAAVAAANEAPAAPADAPAYEQRQQRGNFQGNRRPRGPTLGPPRTMSIEEVEVGKEYDGVIVSIRDFGAFVNVGVQNDGLLHISQISTEFVRNVADAVSTGQEVRVRVLNVDLERGKFAVTMIPPGAAPPRRERRDEWRDDGRDDGERPQLKQQARAMKQQKPRSTRPPPVSPGDVVTGRVASVAAFGVFVELGSDGFTGLLHESEMVREDGAAPLAVGDEVQVSVASVRGDKVALSQRSAEELEKEKELRNTGVSVMADLPTGAGRLAQQLARAGISSDQFGASVGFA